MKTIDELLDAYVRAYESVGGHPNRAARGLGIAAVLDLVAEDVHSNPAPASIVSGRVRQLAADIRGQFAGAGVDRDGPG